MKFSAICLLATTFAASSMATVNITTPETPLHVGDTVELKYSTDTDYTLELVFAVKGTEPGTSWSTVKIYFDDKKTPSGNGSFSVKVPNVSPEGNYAFWLSGMELQGNAGYAALTDWFKVEGGDESWLWDQL